MDSQEHSGYEYGNSLDSRRIHSWNKMTQNQTLYSPKIRQYRSSGSLFRQQHLWFGDREICVRASGDHSSRQKNQPLSLSSSTMLLRIVATVKVILPWVMAWLFFFFLREHPCEAFVSIRASKTKPFDDSKFILPTSLNNANPWRISDASTVPSLIEETLEQMKNIESLPADERPLTKEERIAQRRSVQKIPGVPLFSERTGGGAALMRLPHPTILQINIGLYCNQACHHCHGTKLSLCGGGFVICENVNA